MDFLTSDLPLISCIMPTYGRPAYVNEAVQMFLAQDYPHKELILLNDCSGQQFDFDHEDVRVFNIDQRYSTLGEKRNDAVELACGELLAVWDDDDVYMPWRLSFSLAEMRRYQTPFYRAAEFWAYWGGPELHDNQSVPGWVHHPNTLFTKELWSRVGGYPDQGVGEDAEFLRKIDTELGEEFLKYPLESQDRFFLMRGKSHYAHMSIGGGDQPADERPGRYPIVPQPIADPILRMHYDRLIRERVGSKADPSSENQGQVSCSSTSESSIEQEDSINTEKVSVVLQSVPAKKRPALSICISLKNRSRVNHEKRRLELFPNCVRSLVEAAANIAAGELIELVVADFGSDDWPLVEWLPQRIGNLAYQIISVPGPFSRGKGLNIAAKYAKSEQLFLCDADILFETVALQRALAVLGQGQVWLPVCRYLNEVGEPVFWQDLGYGLVALSREIFELAEGVPEFESWGGEDEILRDALATCAKSVRERSQGLYHQWHPDSLRFENYCNERGSDYCAYMKDLAKKGIAGSVIQSFVGEHPHWRDEIHLYANGRMTRPGIDAGNYQWQREERLLLQWDRWPAEELFWDDATKMYCAKEIAFILRPIGNNENNSNFPQTGPTKVANRGAQLARDDLAVLSTVFEQLQVRWSLQGGSVLGSYRDGGFLPQESDVDLVILAEDWSREVEQAVQELGFRTWIHHQNTEDNGLHVCWQRGDHPWIFDVYPTYQGTFWGTRLRYNGGDRYWRYYFPPEFLEETRQEEFLGVSVRIPADTDGYLRWLYGDDYRTPISDADWDWKMQPEARAWNVLRKIQED